jgi:hypothetical protein
MRTALARLAPRLACVPLVAAAACADPAYTVVTVEARPAVTGVRTLEVSLANGSSTQTEAFAVDGRDFPLTFSVGTGERAGELAITVDALDAAGDRIADGATTAPLTGGDGAATVMLEPADFLVNTSFVGDQALAFRAEAGGRQVAVSPTGVATIGWSDSCQVVGRCDVFGRRFDATGRPVTTALAAGPGEFIVNRTDVTGYEPSVATNAAGTTLAVWSTGGELLAVAVDAGGDALTPFETEIATGTTPSTPAVTAIADGRFVVAWTERAPAGTQYLVRARYLGTDGRPAVNPITLTDVAFTVSTTVLADGNPPAIAWLNEGAALAIAWRSGSTIRGRFYASSGQPRVGNDGIFVTRPAVDLLGEPQLAAIDRDVALLYPRTTSDGGDADDGQLRVRRLSSTGALVGSEQIVTDGVEPTPAALASSATGLAVAWTTCGADSDGDGCAVRVRRLDPSLAPLGPARLANSVTAGDQLQPSLAFLPDGSVILAWTDGSTTAPDRDGDGIRARIVY